jgi:enamine deaminase RidA (YjgF/YER057c/UK114 family)
MTRKQTSTSTPWESLVGYSRGVRVGPYIHISGTTATNEDGEIVAINDPYGQTAQVIRNIQAALRLLRADLRHVVRTRIYVTNIDHWEEIGKAHNEFFADIRPTTTMVEVSRLISPDMLVEIDADAIAMEA